jgi:type 1 glutamine amidotransferase
MFSTIRRPVLIVARALALGAIALAVLMAQPLQGQAPPGGGGGARGGANVAASLVGIVDTNKDSAISREEWKAAFTKWFAAADTAKAGSVTQEQLTTAITAALAAAPPSAAGFGANGRVRRQPRESDVQNMQAALPASAPAKPRSARKILVLSVCSGFVHTCIPVVDKTVEDLGLKTKAWTTTISYNPADINTANLKQYDAVFLNNTTGAFLDERDDPAATAARKQALLEFVRSGKGLVGVHAAADSYRQSAGGTAPRAAMPAAPAAPAAPATPPAPAGASLATQMIAQGDKNADAKLDAAEMNALADAWFDKMDTEKTGSIAMYAFSGRYASLMPQAAPRAAGARAGAPAAPAQGRPGRDTQMASWPEFNRMIGGYFKWHWLDPTHIDYKIDDPKSPLTKMFVAAMPFSIDDETYTFSVNADSYSRTNLHVLTSIDYAKMTATEKAKEDFKREDDDYGLSWIRREGKGRVFYEAHGHNEKIYANKTMLEHILAGVQYAMGDLAADDSPSQKK